MISFHKPRRSVRRYYKLGLALLLSLLAGWLLVGGIHAQKTSVPLEPEDDPEYVLGAPCGSGELLPEWTICLHGGVSLVDAEGTSLLAGVPITVTHGGQVVTGTTFVHPGHTTPTYGIDISPLEPLFLKPVTVTADVSGTQVTRQVIVYPDFRTQNQHVDLRVPSVGALDPAPIWGSVVAFSARGPVTGAMVTATANGQAVMVTTTVPFTGEQPIYTFSQADLDILGVTPEDPLTLTASYDGDSDSHVVALTDSPQQVSFVAGWKCDDFDPLPRTSGGEGMPRTSGGEGMPRTSGGEGMPNVACFWGYGVVDGEPRPDVSVWVEISGTLQKAATRYFAGEDLPRYGIGLWGGESISGQLASVTGVYEGHTAHRHATVTLDADLSQRVDLSINDAEALSGGPYGGSVKSMAFTPDFSGLGDLGSAWLVVSGASNNVYRRSAGAVTWRLENAGLEGYRFDSIATSPDCDASNGTGSLWALARSPDQGFVVARRSCAEEPWQVVHDLPAGGSGTDGIYVSGDYDETGYQGIVWAAIESGHLYSYSVSLDRWYDIPLPPLVNGIQAFAASPDYDPTNSTGTLWVATQRASGGLAAYRTSAYANTWESVADGLPGDDFPQAHALVFAPGGALWMGTTQGVYKLAPGDATWQKQGRLTDDGLEAVYDLVLSPSFDEALDQGYVFVAATEGVFRLPAGTLSWQEMGAPNFREYATRLAVSPDFNEENDQGTLLAGFSRFGLFEYRDNSWHDVKTGLLHLPIRDLSVLTQDEGQDVPGNVWAAGWGGIFVSRDSGSHWARVDADCSQHMGGEVFAVSPDYHETARTGSIWLFNGYDRVLRWPAGGTNWHEIDPLLESDIRGIVFTPDYDEALGQGSVWSWMRTGLPYQRSGPEGTWISVTKGLPVHPQVVSLHVTPDYDEVTGSGSVWATTASGIYRLPAGTTSWVTVTAGSPLMRRLVFSADYDEIANTGVVVGASGQDVYQRFQNGDDTWHAVGNPLPSTVNAVAISPDYDGVGRGTIWVGTSEGLYSLQPGQHSWSKIDAIVVSNGIVEIVPSSSYKADRTLFLATSGDSVIRYVVPTADLHLSFDPPSTLSSPSSVATYTLIYGNAGQEEAGNSVLTMNLSPGIDILASSVPSSGKDPYQWHLNTIPAGTQRLLTITAQLSPTLEPGQAITITADVQSDTPEDFLVDNHDEHVAHVVAPDRADARVSLVAPTALVPGTDAVYTLWADNIGGLDARTTAVTVDLPPPLAYQGATFAPTSLSPLTWHLGTLATNAAPTRVALTATVANTLPLDSDLAVIASITTATPDADPLNDTATVTASTTLTDAITLILAAPERLTSRYGASPLLSELHHLAAHPRVRGAVIDICTDPAVGAAYAAWDADPASAVKANAVAEAIKALIDDYTITYPNLNHIVLVGNDEMLPFYRVRDRNPTQWHERRYCPHMPDGTVRSALCADYFLTDDFYADRAVTYPTSPFWEDGHPLYLPDFAIGRLVERPDEIIAAIDAFLKTDGDLVLDPVLVGTHDRLVDDLGTLQCEAFRDTGLTTTCTTQPADFRTQVHQGSWGSLWAAFHSNHRNLGQLSAFDLRDNDMSNPLTSLVAAIGCHSGTSVDDGSQSYLSYDLPQACQQRGWPFIAPTAYAYASRLEVEYSEALMEDIATQLLLDDGQALGLDLIRAKQAYYADRAWFDYTDEKVLLPMTLYGLPMTHVTLPAHVQLSAAEEKPPSDIHELDHLTLVTHTMEGLTFTLHTTEDGAYYAYRDQVIAQDGYPIQPSVKVPLASTIEDRSIRGIRLQGAAYMDETAFDPVIAQSWAIGEPRTGLIAEPPLIPTGWDRPFPHSLGHFQGLKDAKTALNVMAGAFEAKTNTERRFINLTIGVFYGEGEDHTAPVIDASGFSPITNLFSASVEDNDAVWQVTALCDDGHSRWIQVPLESSGAGTWVGQTQLPVTRYALQAVDVNGNVARMAWRVVATSHNLYLPLVLR